MSKALEDRAKCLGGIKGSDFIPTAVFKIKHITFSHHISRAINSFVPE